MAQESYGVLLQEEDPNSDASFASFHASALAGLPVSQLAVGDAFRDGVGRPKDDHEALRWYRMGAYQGDVVCKVSAAEIMFEPAFVASCWKEATELLCECAVQFVSEFRALPGCVIFLFPLVVCVSSEAIS
jgi:hypothetical protein